MVLENSSIFKFIYWKLLYLPLIGLSFVADIGKNLILTSYLFWRGLRLRWRRRWHLTPVLLPGKSHGQRSLVGRKESDTTEWHHFHFSLLCIGEGNGNPLQCSCLENPRDGGAWWAAVYGVAQSQTRLKRLSSSTSAILFFMSSWFCLPSMCFSSDFSSSLSLLQSLSFFKAKFQCHLFHKNLWTSFSHIRFLIIHRNFAIILLEYLLLSYEPFECLLRL